MISREQIESILKINGVEPGSADETIRSVLLSARYSKDEIDSAIMVLREDTSTNTTRVDGLHKVFRSSEALRPQEISNLLGVEVNVDSVMAPEARRRDFTGLQQLMIWMLSLLLAGVGVLFYMYLHKIGVFHPSVEITFLQ